METNRLLSLLGGLVDWQCIENVYTAAKPWLSQEEVKKLEVLKSSKSLVDPNCYLIVLAHALRQKLTMIDNEWLWYGQYRVAKQLGINSTDISRFFAEEASGLDMTISALVGLEKSDVIIKEDGKWSSTNEI